jgi:acetylcholinesterase
MATRINIDVAQGTVSGLEANLPNGGKYHAFKGIPYAVPPIGELRFQAPRALDKFPNPVQDCSEDGEICFQRDMTTAVLGSEDCLSLNVYVPAVKSDKMPVMVWIHGGAFMNGSGSSAMYSPEHLVQENVIIVTVNYRLGPLGFLSLPSGGVEGNAGLKDQLLALKWVQQNISQFNGDPNNVTLFGESAGGAAVHLHLLSENSRQYFHKVICQSGTSTIEWVMQQDATTKAKKLAKVCGHEGEASDRELLEYMRSLPKEEIAMIQQIKVLTADERRRGLPMPFKPVVEPQSQDAVVTERPLDAMKRRNLFDIPVMIGANDAEGIIMLPNVLKKLDEIDQDVARYIPK